MIFHEQILHPGETDFLEWWAVNSETLTLARCVVEKGPRFFMDVVTPERKPVALCSHPLNYDLGDAAIGILVDCRHRFGQLAACPCTISQIAEADAEIPEYILLGTPGNLPQAIMHTTDPQFISYYMTYERMPDRKQMLSYRSRVPLPPAGWDYWCTDARQEFESLSDRYLSRIQNQLAGAH